MEQEKSSGFRFWTILLLVGLFSLLLTALSWAKGKTPPVADELILQYKAGVSEEAIADAIGAEGASTEGEIPQVRIKKIKVHPQAIDKVKERLARNPHVNFVESNYFAEPSALPNDFYYPSQWHLAAISAPQGWDISTGSSSVPIAIIDTGIDPTHPDLAAKLLPGYNFYAGNTDTHDVYGHGTAVAGSAAAISNNSIGVTGVTWQSPIMPLVISDSLGYATYYDMAQAITYAADHGIRVINISFGGPSNSSTLESVITYAWNKGALIFAAAGNSASSTPEYPAACQNAIAVAATNSSDTPAYFSNFGTWVDISAPGQSILTTTNGGGYGSVSGTSFSSPIAAGLGALVLSVKPSLTNVQAFDLIKQNADDLGAPGFDPNYGAGRINVYRTLLAAKASAPQPDTTPPTVSITSPANSSSVSGTTTVNVSASDNVGVSKVELYINGTLFAADSTSPFSFSWDTTKYSNGTYSLTALAYDSSGNVGRSGQIGITVNNVTSRADNVAPTVKITSPQNGSYLTTRKTSISVSSSDNVGVIKIELYIDGVLRSVVAPGSSLSFTWNLLRVARGSHIISARAYDGAGNVGNTMITVYR